MARRCQSLPITDLCGGLNVNADPAYIKEKESPNILCARFEDGLLKKDFGYLVKGSILLGRPLLIDTFYQTDADEYLLVLTTTSLFVWDTTLEDWVDMTQGATVDDCEDIWLAKTNVTSTVSTDKKRGTYSVQLAVAAGFTTGLVATEDLSSANYTAYTHLHYWIKSSVACAAGDLEIMLDDTAACASPLETLKVPALVANTWTRVSVALGTPADLTAVISVGLNMKVAKGACTILIDDIRCVKELTGTEDNRIFGAVLNDYYIFTNGVDEIKKFDGTAVTALGGSPPSYAKCIVAFQNRLVVGGTEESGTAYPQRLRWSSVGTIETWSGGTSGYVDLVDTVDWIVNVVLLRDKCLVYKERSIYDLNYIGGMSVFSPKLLIGGIGTLSAVCIQDIGEYHLFLSSDGIYEFDGVRLTDQSTNIFPILFETGVKILDVSYLPRASAIFIEELGEYWLSACTTAGAGVPDVQFKQSKDKAWVRRNDQNICCYGLFKSPSTIVTWEGITGTWAAQQGTWKYRSLAGRSPTTLFGKSDSYIYEDNRATGTSEEFLWETKDFIFGHAYRFLEFRLYARYGPFTVYYSTDGGSVWTSLDTLVHQADWKEQVVYLNITSQRIRFKVSCTANDLEIKWVELRYIPRDRSKTLVS